MKYLGNFIDWIPDGLIDTVRNNTGDITPVYQPEKWRGTPEIEAARIALEEAGYPEQNLKFHQFTRQTQSIKEFMERTGWEYQDPVAPHNTENSHWWIVKYLPGDMQPMHFDPHVKSKKKCYRYIMMLTDFEDGHIFTYDDYLLTDYKKGDLFLWDDSNVIHGAANIGMETRISLQISYYDEE